MTGLDIGLLVGLVVSMTSTVALGLRRPSRAPKASTATSTVLDPTSGHTLTVSGGVVISSTAAPDHSANPPEANP